MSSRTRWIGRRGMALAVIAIGVVAIGGTAVAGHMTSGVKSYTGCLVPKDGVIIKVKQGDEPAGPCTGGMTQVHLSGGDITKISVTGALTGGGDNGEVTIGLKPEFTLPSGCATGQVAKWSGTAWACAADADTRYTSGTGLALDTTTAPDTFSIAPDYRVKNTPDCPSGQFTTGFDSSGAVECAAPSSTGVEVWHRVRPAIGAGTVIVLPEGEGVDVITMTVPAGTFLVTAVVTLEGRGTDEFFGSCQLRDAAFNPLPVQSGALDVTDGAIGNVTAGVTLHGVVSFTGETNTIRFTCTSGAGDGEARNAAITAVKVGALHTQ